MSQFQQDALRTEIKDYAPSKERLVGDLIDVRITHLVIGITTEALEFASATDNTNFKEELGDIAWFSACALDCFSVVPDTSITTTKTVVELSEAIGSMWKARCFYGKAFDKTLFVNLLQELYSHTTVEARDACIAKLKARYPGKFTEADAVARADKQ
jgi:hypothetical protein